MLATKQNCGTTDISLSKARINNDFVADMTDEEEEDFVLIEKINDDYRNTSAESEASSMATQPTCEEHQSMAGLADAQDFLPSINLSSPLHAGESCPAYSDACSRLDLCEEAEYGDANARVPPNTPSCLDEAASNRDAQSDFAPIFAQLSRVWPAVDHGLPSVDDAGPVNASSERANRVEPVKNQDSLKSRKVSSPVSISMNESDHELVRIDSITTTTKSSLKSSTVVALETRPSIFALDDDPSSSIMETRFASTDIDAPRLDSLSKPRDDDNHTELDMIMLDSFLPFQARVCAKECDKWTDFTARMKQTLTVSLLPLAHDASCWYNALCNSVQETRLSIAQSGSTQWLELQQLS